jgi:lipid-binding SYLF domain-containing protein
MKLSCPMLSAGLLALSLFTRPVPAEEIPPQASPRNATAERLNRAASALQEFRRNATATTRKLFDSAQCIVIAPRRLPEESATGAPGFLTCRRGAEAWTNPAAVNIADGGVVWSFAGTQMDIVILAENPGAAAALRSKDVMFGVDPAIQPGPLTEDQIRPQPASAPLLFSYEQSAEGIRAIQLGGATLSQEPVANAALYGKQLNTPGVFALKAANTKSASLSSFLSALPSVSRVGM